MDHSYITREQITWLYPGHHDYYILVFHKLNYWYTTFVTICYFICSGCNTPLMVKHLFSNGLIEIIYSITWIDAIYLEHCVSWGFLPSVFKQRYSFTDGGSFNDVFGVGKICRCRVGWSLIWTWVVVVFGSCKSVSLWLCFLGVEKYCE